MVKINTMKETIKSILLVKDKLKITANQALFLIAAKENLYTVDLPSSELLDLIKRDFMRSNRVTSETIEKLDNILVNNTTSFDNQICADYPILTRDTGEIVKKLSVPFLGDRLNVREIAKLKEYCKSNALMIPFLFMFLEMFPTSDAKRNASWNKQFNTEWSQMTLRRLSNGTVQKFKQIWKTKDIGLFLLGTYLFIQHSYSEESKRYFIKNIENYLKEYQNWYNMAKDLLDEGKLDYLVKRTKTNYNTTVL